jgi:parallel beta-helix repeat protein
MIRSKLSLCLAATLAMAAQTASAQVSGLPAEINAREAADAQLQSNINAEATARAAADIQLQRSIDTESAARAAAALQLQRNIDGEAGARAAGDTQLQTQIDQLRSSIGSGGGGGGSVSVTVDCTTGGSLSQALASGAQQITVRGRCTESLDITRDGVTLLGEPGATISGPDPSVNTINVRANRVTIDGLTVTGGRNGITGVGAANLTVRNCTAENTGRTGISFANGSSGTVDGCIVQFNGRDGVSADGAQATIVNSTITGNARNGVLIANGGTARVGLTDRLVAAGNTITQNGGTGVSVVLGSMATIAMNTISGNGTNPSLPRFGVAVSQAAASIAGGNTISDNAGQGVFAGTGSSVLLGDLNTGLTTVNTISHNGNPASPGGVHAFLGSTIVVRDALIELNNGPGLMLNTRSLGQIFSSTIQDNRDVPTTTGLINKGDGIRVIFGSSLLGSTPASSISRNAGIALQCTDQESSTNVNSNGAIGATQFLLFSGNQAGTGDFSTCSGF